MADVHNNATRSYNMSRIKGKDTKPEMLVRKFLHARGLRYRLHVNNLPGKPDIVLPKYDTIIHVHGCYFHRHRNCKLCTTPAKSSKTDWVKKFEGTVARDKRNDRALRRLGWRVIIIWECDLKPKKLLHTLSKLHRKIISSHITTLK
jgi:DNA mismatch endonuclease, patch repair protein